VQDFALCAFNVDIISQEGHDGPTMCRMDEKMDCERNAITCGAVTRGSSISSSMHQPISLATPYD